MDARLTPAGPLGLSSLVLTDPAVRVDGRMKFVVDGRVGGSSVAAYVEMQRLQPSAGTAADRPEVQFEVARTEDGPALVGSVPPVADETGSAAWYAEGTINLASLAPGPYVVRAIVVWNGAVVGRVGRSIIIDAAQRQWHAVSKVAGEMTISHDKKGPACRDGMRGRVVFRGRGGESRRPRVIHARRGT